MNPIEMLAAALRKRIAAGQPVHPELLSVMDGLLPGWRDDCPA